MIIERYSVNGFIPQYQSHHLKDVDYHLNEFNLNVFPEYFRETIKDIHDKKVMFYKENYDDLKYGIWAFINGYKRNMALNHLKKKVPCWKAEISNNTIVIDSNWSEKIKITDESCKLFGFFIPLSQLETLKILK